MLLLTTEVAPSFEPLNPRATQSQNTCTLLREREHSTGLTPMSLAGPLPSRCVCNEPELTRAWNRESYKLRTEKAMTARDMRGFYASPPPT